MKESSKQFLEKAGRAIEATEVLLTNEHMEFAVGRAYYALFYVSEALLYEKDLRFSKHGGVHAHLGNTSSRQVSLMKNITVGC